MWVGPISSCLPGGGQFAVAWRRRGAFCKGIVSTARRGGFLLLLQKEAKQGKGEPGFPLCKPLCRLAVLATDLDFSREKNPNPYCAQMRSKGSHGVSGPTALRCPKKSSRCSLARFFRPLRVLRLAASATGGARLRTPYPSPVAGEGPSGQVTACFTHSLGSVTFCDWLAETKLKINLISVV